MTQFTDEDLANMDASYCEPDDPDYEIWAEAERTEAHRAWLEGLTPDAYADFLLTQDTELARRWDAGAFRSN